MCINIQPLYQETPKSSLVQLYLAGPVFDESVF